MEANVNYTVVGLFVITLTATFVFGIIWLSSGAYWGEEYKTYQVFMQESVSGLNIDSPVEYNGVNVGTVSQIAIDHKNPKLVQVLLSIKQSTPITLGTRAKLDARALSGIAYILLEDKGTNMTPLVAQPGQHYPVITTTPSLFVRLDTALTQMNNSFQQLSTSIRALLNKENLESVKELLKSSQSVMQQLETQTIPITYHVMENLENITQNLSGVSAEIKQNPALLIRGRAQPVLGPGEQ